uniref:Uncharacterized protein n=1 Tax=Globodera rostochiensis TaxID=31243 RepID=A0A914H093_GLORO
MLICAGKILKKTGPRKDQIIAKLHFKKVEKLIGSDFEDEFSALLSKKSKLWGELFDLEGIGKLKAILLAQNEYFISK